MLLAYIPAEDIVLSELCMKSWLEALRYQVNDSERNVEVCVVGSSTSAAIFNRSESGSLDHTSENMNHLRVVVVKYITAS